MLTLYNEKLEVITELYQWSKNIVIAISLLDASTVEAVEFANDFSAGARNVKFTTQNNIVTAQIPNGFLTVDKTITIYIRERIGKDGVTISHSALLTIIPKPKPDDYVFSEEEIRTYEALEQRISELEKNKGTLTEEDKAEIAAAIDLTGYATEDYVETAITNAFSTIGIAEEGAY